jgi:5-methylcytosine-specific restriction endonuclease McrA
MAKKRTRLPKALEKRIYQEAGSKCVFCPESDVVTLQVHHIDNDPANNAFENLLLVCATCHAKVTGGVMSLESVRLKKRQLSGLDKSAPKVLTSVEGIYFQRRQFMPRRLSPRDMRMRGAG